MPPEEKRELLVNEELINITRKVFYYGCYSAKDFNRNDGIKSASFSRYKSFLQYAFGSFIEELPLKNSKMKVLHFRTDEFEVPFNILLDLYTLKKISSTEFILFLKLMYFFAENNEKNNYSLSDIYRQIPIIKDNVDDCISERTFHRKFDELVNYGYIKRAGKKNFLYSKPENILNTLDNKNICMLTAFADLCRNIYHPAVCGHYLLDTLSIINSQRNISYDTVFLCKHLHMGQVLEDGNLWKLITAIYEKKIISFYYKGKNSTKKEYRFIQPHKIIISETDGRRYLFCIILENERNGGILFRLDNISKIKEEKQNKENPVSFLSEEETEIIYHNLLDRSFTGTCLMSNKLQTATLIYTKDFCYEIQNRFPEAVPENEDDTHDKIHIEVNSLTELNPWLRRNLGKVRIADTSDNTAEDFEKELTEWRAMYGIV